MPKKTRSPEVVEKVKDDIIEAALELILNDGFSMMSMRKLAGKVGMTATNLYYYYSGKDEIYLHLQIKGFKLLNGILKDIYDAEQDPVEALRQMIRAYLDFGFTKPDYYRIMLNSDTPRYTEYKDTELEPVAFTDKKLAVDMGELVTRVISDIARNNPSLMIKDADFKTKQLWITLHGIVVLKNKNILAEADDDPEKLINRMCEEIMAQFTSK